jgi:hypothetical protein
LEYLVEQEEFIADMWIFTQTSSQDKEYNRKEEADEEKEEQEGQQCLDN